MSGIPQPIRNPKSLSPVVNPDATDEYNTAQIAEAAEESKPKVQIDYMDETIEESMPASDPPASTPTTGIGPPAHRAGKAGS